MITFKKIRFKNILSFGNEWTTIDFESASSFLVRGTNGSGKSAGVLDTVCFAFFGKPFRKINKPILVNYKNKKDLVVEMWFDVDNQSYHIIRGMNPQFFEIYKDETLIDQSPAIRDYQDYFEKNILRMDYQMFIQLVILGKASYIAFFRLQLHERRKFIENILNLSIFGVMNEINKVRITEAKNTLSVIKTDLLVLKEKIQLREIHLETLKREQQQQRKDLEEQVKQQVKRHRKEIQGYEKQIETLRVQMEDVSEDLDVLNKRLENNYDIQSKLNDRIMRLQKRIKFFQDNATCPTCDTELDHSVRESKAKDLEEKKKALVEAELSLKEKIDSISAVIRDIQKKLDLNRKLQKEIEIIDNLIKQQNNAIDQLRENKDRVLKSKGTFEDSIHNEESEIKTLKSDYEVKTEERMGVLSKIECLDFIATMLKDTGIKTIIIKRYIPSITRAMNNYLRSLGLFVRFELNENFEEMFFSRGVNPQNYYSFSEGEKLRIDLAMLMTWREICKLQNNMDVNFIIFDEILDASLDESGSENLINLFNLLTQSGTNVMVVSHSSDRWEDKFDKCLTFSKISGFSRIEEN